MYFDPIPLLIRQCSLKVSLNADTALKGIAMRPSASSYA